MGRWDAMKAAFEAAPEGTAVVLWRLCSDAPWQRAESPGWYDGSEYRLFLNVTDWQPPAQLYQARVEIPRPLTTVDGHEVVWLVGLLGIQQIIVSNFDPRALSFWIRKGLIYATEGDANARRDAMLRVEEA